MIGAMGWFYFLVIIGIIYWAWKSNSSSDDNTDVKSTQRPSEQKVVSTPAQTNKAPSASPEVMQIHEEAKKRKKRAEELGLPKLFSKLFFERIYFYPAWKERKFENHVPESIEEAKELSESEVKKFLKEVGDEKEAGDRPKGLLIVNNGRRYTFVTSERSSYLPYEFDSDLHGYVILRLYEESRLVLVLEYKHYIYEYGSSHEPNDVEGFIEDDWVSEFKALGREDERISKLSKENWEKKMLEDEAEKMKKNFGL